MTLIGQILLIEVPVVSGATLAGASWVIQRTIRKADTERERVADTLDRHDDALALLINQVTPPGAPSLTETLHAMQLQLAVINERQSHGAAENAATGKSRADPDG